MNSTTQKLRSGKRALKCRITDIETIERIALLVIKDSHHDLPLVQIDENLKTRQSYLEGGFTDRVDLTVYDQGDDDG